MSLAWSWRMGSRNMRSFSRLAMGHVTVMLRVSTRYPRKRRRWERNSLHLSGLMQGGAKPVGGRVTKDEVGGTHARGRRGLDVRRDVGDAAVVNERGNSALGETVGADGDTRIEGIGMSLVECVGGIRRRRWGKHGLLDERVAKGGTVDG